MSVMNPPDYTELLQEIKRLNARIDELESKNKALSDEDDDLKKLLHEQGALKGAKTPEFKEDYSVEKNKGFGKKDADVKRQGGGAGMRKKSR